VALVVDNLFFQAGIYCFVDGMDLVDGVGEH